MVAASAVAGAVKGQWREKDDGGTLTTARIDMQGSIDIKVLVAKFRPKDSRCLHEACPMLSSFADG